MSSSDCHLDFGQIACSLEFFNRQGNIGIFRRVLGKMVGGGALETIYLAGMKGVTRASESTGLLPAQGR